MIKINLLELKREVKQKKKLPKFLVTWGAITGTCLLLAALGYFGMEWHLSNMKAEKKQNEQEIASLKKKIDEVQKFERMNKDFEQKVTLIENLRKNQSAPVMLLDELSTILTTADGVWLTSLNYSGDAVTTDGFSYSNETLVTFVDALKKSPKVTDVNLVESNRTTQDSVTVYKFKLTCRFKV